MSLDPKAGAQFASIRSNSIVTEVHRQIREQLLAGAFSPGEALRESVLADQMGVSRSPVREALRLLQESGLVTKTHNRPYEASPIAVGDIAELAALRLADETLAVRLLIQRKTPLHAVAALVEQIRAAHLRLDTEAVSIADVQFHATIIQLTQFPRLVARYANLTDQIRFVMLTTGASVAKAGETLDEPHERMLRALIEAQANGDPTHVLKMWEEHILGGMREADLLTSIYATGQSVADD